jgi:hypothetical protein
MQKTISTALPALVAVALLSSCTTRMPPSRNAYVYIAENTAITFDGETFLDVDDLPRRLVRAGAGPENTIVIIPQGAVPEVYLRKIVSTCGKGGMPNVVIREHVAPSATVQKSGTGIQKQPGATPPRFVPPGAKGKTIKGLHVKDPNSRPVKDAKMTPVKESATK